MTDRRSLAILLLVQIAIIAVVDPRGNFPVNDDWAFAHSVRWLLEEGRVRVSDWAAMNLLPQTVAGALVTALFGFSFAALRHLTQCVAVLALFGAYAWFRAARFDARDALVATLVVAAFPAWAVLSNSYMTDLYGAALAWPSAALFAIALRQPTLRALAGATILAAIAVLERQVALVVPFAFMVASLWTRRPWTATALAAAIAPFLCTLGAALAYYAYLVHGPGVPEAQRVTNERLIPMAVDAATTTKWAAWALGNASALIGYLGLFAAGWTFWYCWRFSRRTRSVLTIAGVAAGAAAIWLGELPPYLPDNVVDAAGIGPFMLYDATRGIAPLDRGAGLVWPIAGATAAFVAIGLAFAFASSAARAFREGRNADAVSVFVLVLLVVYVAPFVVTAFFDRYLLFVLPFVLVLWQRAGRGDVVTHPLLRKSLAAGWIAAVFAWSLTATHDYFAWNRARWDAIHLAEGLGGTAASIDGGFEYNGLERFEIQHESLEGKSWYWVRDDLYVVAFSNVPGYDEVKSFPVKRWLPRTPAEVKLLRRRS